MGITSSGIGSGLDIRGLVGQLVAAEGQPAAARLNRQEAGFQTKLSALGTLKSALADFQTSLEGLSELSAFQGRTASTSDKEVFTATAASDAMPGAYSIEVLRLAQEHRVGSATFASGATLGGTAGDNFTITVGTASVDVDLSTAMTLEEIRDEINRQAKENGAGVSATVINGDGGVQRLVLAAAETGYADRLQFGGTIDQAGTPTDSATVLGLATLNVDANGVVLATEAELDASVKVDGLTVTRGTNSLSDVIEGVTLELAKASPGTVEELTVALDTDSVKSAVKSFVDSFNELKATMDELGRYNSGTGEKGALLGDATLRNISSQTRQELGRFLSGDENTLSSLADIGVAIQRDGTLALDNSALSEAMDSHFDEIAQLFASEEGIATRLDTVLSGYLGSTGSLESRIGGLNESVEDIGDQRESLSRRLEALERRYLDQFIALDTLVGQLQSTSTYLGLQLANLPGTYRKD